MTASEDVLATLQALAQADLPLCQELALELKRLESNPEPKGSRPLEPGPPEGSDVPLIDEPDPRDRVFETLRWAIWYRYDPEADDVQVAHIEIFTPSATPG